MGKMGTQSATAYRENKEIIACPHNPHKPHIPHKRLWSRSHLTNPLQPLVRPRLRVQKKGVREIELLFSTRSRGRTGTAITGHRILSPACLPIPPFEQHGAKVILYILFSKKSIIESNSVGENQRISSSRRNQVICRLAYLRELRLISSMASSRDIVPSK